MFSLCPLSAPGPSWHPELHSLALSPYFLRVMVAPQSSLVFHDVDTSEDCWSVILYNVPRVGFACCFHMIRQGMHYWKGTLEIIIVGSASYQEVQKFSLAR